MKKIAWLFIALSMLLSLSVTAFANEREVVIGTVHTNEYDYILSLQNATTEELAEMGLTRAQANEVISELLFASKGYCQVCMYEFSVNKPIIKFLL